MAKGSLENECGLGDCRFKIGHFPAAVFWGRSGGMENHRCRLWFLSFWNGLLFGGRRTFQRGAHLKR